MIVDCQKTARHIPAQLLKFTDFLAPSGTYKLPPASRCRHCDAKPPKCRRRRRAPIFMNPTYFVQDFMYISMVTYIFVKKNWSWPLKTGLFFTVLHDAGSFTEERWCRQSRRNAATTLMYGPINFYHEGLLHVQRASLGTTQSWDSKGGPRTPPPPIPTMPWVRGLPTKG